ncbi:MAG: family 2 glycosyl transferase [Epsilonproteobacteria bacterium (ex Lamellibrachia satsuma)]|nr:MAG: family 2 glycosyl transferase [Epsilonproteobacteria bacterium (ex Lamellibrachia satsuma)]
MKISIITSVYNNKETIAEAIESVLSQTYDNIEYIVVDGASADGTMDVIKQYADKITTFVSEPDNGIYDGLNKGVALATGDVVGFLHSDDLFEDEHVVAKIAEAFQESKADSIYGDLTYVSKEDTSKVVRFWKSGIFSINKLKRGWMPPHPTFYVKREVYEKYGAFDTSFKIAADYDSILRFLGKEKISTHYIPEVLIKMRVGGASNKSLKNLIQKSREDLRAMKNNGVGHAGSLFVKNASKVPQFFRKAKK